jgi:hypothetical protein
LSHCSPTHGDQPSTRNNAVNKQLHSTKTALIRAQNDIFTEIDRKRGVILVLIDLSAAFDTIDNEILFSQLQHRLGISGRALDWFKSYLRGRTQSVAALSKESVLQFSVPQILRKANIFYHLYADDTQLYLNFQDPVSQQECLQQMQHSEVNIKSSMVAYKLKLNDEKNEIMYISLQFYSDKIACRRLQLAGLCHRHPELST